MEIKDLTFGELVRATYVHINDQYDQAAQARAYEAEKEIDRRWTAMKDKLRELAVTPQTPQAGEPSTHTDPPQKGSPRKSGGATRVSGSVDGR